ncbi:MAG: VWA domain-containing protein [Kiritimatiellae bacterium]|nr:VWA domain-containing protein [Kiritimatiellia bacterium]
MRLAYPLFLLFLLLIPALLYLRHHHRRKPKITYSDATLLQALPQSWAVRFRFILPLCYALGLVCLVIALCRPQRGLSESRVNTSALDIVLTVDVSTSMRAEDFATLTQQHLNRLDAAKEVIRRFILDRPDDRIGLIAFAALPYTVAPLTLDHAWLVGRLEDLQTGMLEDGTAIGDALASAINRLRDSEAKSKIVILLTDGMNNTGKLSPENAAEAARALGIRVYTVGAGATGIVRYPVPSAFGGTQYIQQQSDIDEATLTQIAKTTGGLYFRARDLGELKKVYEEIDRLEKTEITMQQFTRYEERFIPFLLAALLLLLAEKCLSSTRLGRLP